MSIVNSLLDHKIKQKQQITVEIFNLSRVTLKIDKIS